MKRHLKFTALLLLSLVSACRTGEQTEIIAAIESDNTQEVTRLLAAGADVNAIGRDGAMPLHTAAIENRKEVADLLIRAGANVNAKDTRNGWTPLHVAAVKAEMPLVELLIANGADINAKNNAGNTPLYVAAKSNRAELAEWLITKGAEVNARNATDATPLHAAASLRQKTLAELLITKGADIKAKTNEGVTPLYVAAKMDRDEVAELLIAHGAEVDARTKSGYTPLIWVAQQGNRDFAKLLIVHGADINAKDMNGRTPLIWALEIHTFITPYRQLSQLDAAGQQEWQKEIQKLHQISAAEQQELQKELKNAKGQWLEVVKLLIDHGADIKADFKKKGAELLLLAANLGSKDLVESLLAYGADINDAKTGETALHGAIAERHRDVAELLINKGADVTLKSRSGRTPLHFLAFYMDDQKLAELMIKHGTDINARDNNGETPLTFATKAGNNQVAKVLRERGGK